MNSKECEEQLKRLIYDWKTEGLLTKINATDIEAIKHLMLENQVQQDTIKKQKLVIGNLSDRITKAIKYTEEHRINNPYHYEYNCFMGNARASDLLDILKGDKK